MISGVHEVTYCEITINYIPIIMPTSSEIGRGWGIRWHNLVPYTPLLGGQFFGLLLLLLCLLLLLLLFHRGFHPFPIGLQLRDSADSCGLGSSWLDKMIFFSQGHMLLKVTQKVFFTYFLDFSGTTYLIFLRFVHNI